MGWWHHRLVRAKDPEWCMGLLTSLRKSSWVFLNFPWVFKENVVSLASFPRWEVSDEKTLSFTSWGPFWSLFCYWPSIIGKKMKGDETSAAAQRLEGSMSNTERTLPHKKKSKPSIEKLMFKTLIWEWGKRPSGRKGRWAGVLSPVVEWELGLGLRLGFLQYSILSNR